MGTLCGAASSDTDFAALACFSTRTAVVEIGGCIAAHAITVLLRRLAVRHARAPDALLVVFALVPTSAASSSITPQVDACTIAQGLVGGAHTLAAIAGLAIDAGAITRSAVLGIS